MKKVKTMHSLMPLPIEMTLADKELVIDSEFRIELSGHVEPRLERAAMRLSERLAQITGISMHRDQSAAREDATLLIHVDEKVAEVQSATEDESYTLDITAKIAVLRSRKLYGALRGIETFVQLVRQSDYGFVVPAVRIKDRPRFPWRGLLIDVTRHWIPPAVIIRNLEAMASVKMNVLHWHLTDDQGFRIESYRYPKLHELGSDGLFYTQDDVREIVEFASDRGIRVLPEFDMPGHTSSWFVGYPDLASAPGPYRIERNWGGHEATMDPTREETYEFISNFLSEMVTLFPDLYVHVGGDEVSGKQWQGNPDILKFMVSEGIKDTRHLQAYFNCRLHGILNKLGREMVGWDPILHADLPEKSIVQSVRGQKWLAEAVCNGFQGVAGSEYYLDLLRPAEFHYGSDPFGAEAAELTTKQQSLIIGGEASMWTEFA
ncbi:MAG: beta-N-acetylhexosaminidase, partial [Deltaproteobacteria bacterium]